MTNRTKLRRIGGLPPDRFEGAHRMLSFDDFQSQRRIKVREECGISHPEAKPLKSRFARLQLRLINPQP